MRGLNIKSINFFHHNCNLLWGLVWIGLLCVMPLCAQSNRKTMTPEDYDKWYRFNSLGFASEGKWVLFKKSYTDQPDSLFVKEIIGDRLYAIEDCGQLAYVGNKIVIGHCANGRYQILHLASGRMEKMNADKVEVSLNEDYLMMYHKQKKELIIRNLSNGKNAFFFNVYDYSHNPKSNAIAIMSRESTENQLTLIFLNKTLKEVVLLENSSRKVVELTWNAAGDGVAFSMASSESEGEYGDAGELCFYKITKEKMMRIDLNNWGGFPSDKKLVSTWVLPLRITPDDNRILFAFKRKQPVEMKELPEVWKAGDPYIYKGMTYRMHWQNTAKLGIWDVKTNRFIKVTDTLYPQSLINKDASLALLYNPATYQPQSMSKPPIDLYIADLKKERKTLFLKRQLHETSKVSFSPSGRYIQYFREKGWWLYDSKTDVHVNLCKKFENTQLIDYDELTPLLWSKDEDTLFMQGSYDLWEVPIGNGEVKSLTNGRKKGVHYHVLTKPTVYQKRPQSLYFNRQTQSLIFSVKKGDSMGYAILRPQKKLQDISLSENYVRDPFLSEDERYFSFRMERNDQPSKLMIYDLSSDRLQTLFQSNPHYKNYKQGRSKKIFYRNKDGVLLSGILRFPTDYKKDSLYPMIVRVYEKQGYKRFQYVNPTMYNGSGFNSKNYVNNGYFVFLPDISYTIGKPGFSAADCIISGTKAALKEASIDPDRIGLIGHSYGGFETLFTITQTDFFATAIASAGVTDMVRGYLGLQDRILLSYDMYEHFQHRMGVSLFEDYQGYLDNSPIYHATKIHTPFLLWSGKEDYHVNYHQSISFHLAMKRLGKPNSLLLYPQEGHVLGRSESQKDITIKTEQWFAYYLKEGIKYDWMP